MIRTNSFIGLFFFFLNTSNRRYFLMLARHKSYWTGPLSPIALSRAKSIDSLRGAKSKVLPTITAAYQCIVYERASPFFH